MSAWVHLWQEQVAVLFPITNAQTVRGRPKPNDDDGRALRKGSFCELVANISNVAIKFSQVLKRSVSTKSCANYA